MEQKLGAFWRYEGRPWFLYGEILEVLDDGRVKVKEYGGIYVEPSRIIPYDKGKKLNDALELAVSQYEKKVSELLAGTKALVSSIIGVDIT